MFAVFKRATKSQLTFSQDTDDSYPCEARNNKKIRKNQQSNPVTQTTALQQHVDDVTESIVLPQVLIEKHNFTLQHYTM